MTAHPNILATSYRTLLWPKRLLTSVTGRWVILSILPTVVLSGAVLCADESAEAAKKFSPEVETRAEAILDGLDLRRSRDRLMATDVAMLNKSIVDVSKRKRELLMAEAAYNQARASLQKLDGDRERLLRQNRELNVQLAAATSVLANNRIVASINANRAELKSLKTRRSSANENVAQLRKRWHELQSEYADDIADVRSRLNDRLSAIDKGLASKEGQIALRVLGTNHGVSPPGSASELYRPVILKLEKLEAEILRESIPLSVKQRTLVANVVIGTTTIEMIVDTGASVVCLPDAVARELNLQIPPDAPAMTLVLADGNTIDAQQVTLPSVRLGEFEATNVKAAVMSATAIAARPILGMTFLDQFRSELDPAARTLTLQRVNLK